MADIELSIGATTFELPAPSSSSTEILLAIDAIDLDNGTIGTYDNLSKYDKRVCKCSFFLSSTDMASLASLLYDAPQPVTLTLTAGCGFFPFGPDKGDDGIFTTSIVFDGTPNIGDFPFRYFQVKLIMQNVGTYPAYSLPSQIDEGSFTISNVTNLRMPEKMFNASMNYRVSIAHTENSTPLYVYNGEFARYASSTFVQNCNESKAAALIYDLANVVRDNDFLIHSPLYFYIFGIDYGNGYNYCKLSSNKIEVQHVGFDQFEIKLNLRRV